MRILVLSDSHGNAYALTEAIESQPQASAVIFLGDGVREAEEAAERYPQLPFYIVRGNGDFGAFTVPYSQELLLGGKRILAVHGHLLHVKYGLYEAMQVAKDRGVDILLHGHTHQAYTDYRDGLYMMCPGALCSEEYGFIDITDGGVLCRTWHLRGERKF